MSLFLRRYSLVILTIVLLLAGLHLLNRGPERRLYSGGIVSTLIAPIEVAYTSVVRLVARVWVNYIALVDVAEERDELKTRISQFDELRADNAELKEENLRLRRLLHHSQSMKFTSVAAKVVGKRMSNWVQSLRIDRGSADGLRSGMPVLDGKSLVGRLDIVSAHSATVLLITDRGSAVDVLLQRTRAPAIARGNFGRLLKLDYLEQSFDVQPGDRVLTTGFDGIYPPGFLVGVVKTVSLTPGGLFSFVTARPSGNFSRLEEVLILTDSEEVLAQGGGFPDAEVQESAPIDTLLPAQGAAQ